MAATALAERYRDLGFRVIEGGKSNKLAILRTPGITEIFGVRHDNVMRDVELHLESHSSNLRGEVEKHCRRAPYLTSRGREIECFELTKIGFLAIAAKYDADLRFLLALAFDALESADDGAQASVLGQINKRISELRSRATGQDALNLVAPIRAIERADDNLPEDETPFDECAHELAREQENARKTEARLRQIGIEGTQGRLPFEPPAPTDNDTAKVRPPAHPNAHNAYKRDVWVEEEDGYKYPIIKERNHNGDVVDIFFERVPALNVSTNGYTNTLPWINGRTVTLHLSHIIPMEVVERVYLNQLPDGKTKSTARLTLNDYLAV